MTASLLGSRCSGVVSTSSRCVMDSPCGARCPSASRRSANARHCFQASDAPQRLGGMALAPSPRPARLAPGQRMVCAAVAGTGTLKTLGELPLGPVVNAQGYVAPVVPLGVQASVFAIFDEKQKLQYVGFSKNYAATLRTFFSRRPEKAHFQKVMHFQALDQPTMIATRDAWFEEVGGAPAGNKLQLERNAWQNPMDCGARSARGKEGASEERLREALEAIRLRSCRDDFVVDPVLYKDGKIDFLPAVAQSAEVIALAASTAAATAKVSRKSVALVDGEDRPFSVFYRGKLQTAGGYMFDIDVTFEEASSRHRVVVGKEYYEPFGIEPETAIEAALGLLFSEKEVRQTEGLLLSSQFPVNYFSMSGLEQWFGPKFGVNFTRMTGHVIDQEREDAFWRMRRIHDYAGKMDTAEQLDISVGWRA